ncbi:hypothetical protein BL247_22515 [Ralstonia solanacearum]|nr:hypothetical protein BC350_12400 [Ralstonia pseudosolanacearum]AVV68048.1 hypothetical protein RSOE_19720 [Ralstonia solanacearum OE1-1]OIN69333.1 hypothetical protein BL247_22515 [Ralstonia solanacearum]
MFIFLHIAQHWMHVRIDSIIALSISPFDHIKYRLLRVVEHFIILPYVITGILGSVSSKFFDFSLSQPNFPWRYRGSPNEIY